MGMPETLRWQGGGLILLDQTRLPLNEAYIHCHDYRRVAEAIKRLEVRGAPAIGAAAVANAKPDGYTLLISSNSTFTLNPAAGAKTSYDPAKSFEAIGMVGTLPLAVLVNPAVPAQNVQQLVAASKANPDQFPYGSFGNATSSHWS